MKVLRRLVLLYFQRVARTCGEQRTCLVALYREISAFPRVGGLSLFGIGLGEAGTEEESLEEAVTALHLAVLDVRLQNSCGLPFRTDCQSLDLLKAETCILCCALMQGSSEFVTALLELFKSHVERFGVAHNQGDAANSPNAKKRQIFSARDAAALKRIITGKLPSTKANLLPLSITNTSQETTEAHDLVPKEAGYFLF